MKMKRKLPVLMLLLQALIISLSACNDSAGKLSDYGIISDDIHEEFVLEANVRKHIGNIDGLFNGGGYHYVHGNIVRYYYGEKWVGVLRDGSTDSIYSISTTNVKDRTVRGIGPGSALDELLRAYPEDELVLLESWDSVVTAQYDTAYSLTEDNETRRMVFLLS
jgi:hypothetical protein